MPWLMISKQYEEILEDPSLHWLFLEEEWRSFHEFPFLGTLQFQMVWEMLFAHFSSSSMWGQARVEFLSDTSWKISDEIIPMTVLITNGVEEGSLGMVTTFCHHDEAKVESSEVLSILHQSDSPKLSVVVVKIFTNSPYLPWWYSSILYPDVTSLSSGALTT